MWENRRRHPVPKKIQGLRDWFTFGLAAQVNQSPSRWHVSLRARVLSLNPEAAF